MKKIILLMLILCLFGCSAKKKISRSVESSTVKHIETNAKESEIVRTDITEAVRKIAEGESMENVEVIAVIYDTNKPVDPGTGKPPVLADMTIKKVSSYTTKETEESVREDKSVYEKEAELNQVASSQTEIKITETSKTVQKPLWWLYLIGIGVIVAAGWFVYRKMKRG